MYQPIEVLPDSSRVWIYPLNRKLTEAEYQRVFAATMEWCEGWKAHGHSLNAGFEIREDRFLILAVDESSAGASGCSIDGSVHYIQMLCEGLQVEVLDRGIVPFYLPEKNELIFVPLAEIGKQVSEGIINENTEVLNTYATELGQLRHNWLIRIGASWAKRYLVRKKEFFA